MRLRSIYISNIRNLKAKKIDFSADAVFLAGKNGQGKTSVLEAIFMLSHVRSFRSTNLEDIICLNCKDPSNKEAYIRGEVETELGNLDLEISIKNKKRLLKVSDKKIDGIEHFCGRLKTVLFTPEDLEIVKGAPLIRRQFLDRIIVMLKPFDIKLLNEYSKILKFRNRLLKDKKGAEAKLLNERLINLNLEIIGKRQELVGLLKEKVKKYYSKISGLESTEEIDLNYKSGFIDSLGQILSLEKSQELFFDNQQKEIILGRTLLGCHKDELKIDFINKGNRSLSKAISSQGQVRTKVLSFKLASAEIIHQVTGEWPILLLDDVESELDIDRIQNLKEEVLGYNGQVFMTGTSFEKFEISNKNLQKYTLLDGEILEAV